MWFSVACFGVRVSVMFNLMFAHYTFSSVLGANDHLLEKSCPLGWPFALIVFCLFIFSFISHFGFKSGVGFLLFHFLSISILLFSVC